MFGSPGIWMSGIGMFGRFGRSGSEGNDGVRVGDDVSGGPGSVVIATEPSVVCWQPVASPIRISAAAVTRTCVFIS